MGVGDLQLTARKMFEALEIMHISNNKHRRSANVFRILMVLISMLINTFNYTFNNSYVVRKKKIGGIG